jgi:hypothetical protein
VEKRPQTERPENRCAICGQTAMPMLVKHERHVCLECAKRLDLIDRDDARDA